MKNLKRSTDSAESEKDSPEKQENHTYNLEGEIYLSGTDLIRKVMGLGKNQKKVHAREGV